MYSGMVQCMLHWAGYKLEVFRSSTNSVCLYLLSFPPCALYVYIYIYIYIYVYICIPCLIFKSLFLLCFLGLAHSYRGARIFPDQSDLRGCIGTL